MGRALLAALLALLMLWSRAGAAGPCGGNARGPQRERERDGGTGEAACRAQLSLESPLFPGNPGQFQPLSEGLRRYVMSHFRWNRFGRHNGTEPGKRHRDHEEEEEEEEEERKFGSDPGIPEGFSRRSYSMEHFRWGKPVGRKRRPVKVYPNGAEEESEENSRLELRRDEPREEEEEGEEGFWKFPWDSGKEKRYGGFMSAERAWTPLVTLFRNAIGKSFVKDGQ